MWASSVKRQGKVYESQSCMNLILFALPRFTDDMRETLYFQDLLASISRSSQLIDANESSDVEDEPSQIFFQLANVPRVGFRLIIDQTDETVTVNQDILAHSHTGGIVWEASYLLSSYLLDKYKDSNQIKPLGRLLEVGSGCGMLGLVLAASRLSECAVLTETDAVMENLTQNVARNNRVLLTEQVSAQQLRWEKYKEDIDANRDILIPHSFDTIVGTDVIFSIKFVKPLLKTLRKMTHMRSIVLLCIPVRCEDAFSLFLEKAPNYGFECTDNTRQLVEICPWGRDLDCKLLQLLRIKNKNQGDTKRLRRR